MTKGWNGKNSKRALRRHHRQRMVVRALRVVRTMWMPEPSNRGETWQDYDRETARMAVRFHDHLKVCSCWMCGNPRRHFRGKRSLSFSELKALKCGKVDADESSRQDA